MPTFHRVAAVGDVVEGRGMCVVIDRMRIALFLHQGRYFAIDDLCPHMAASLSRGYVEDDIVTCPLHYWRFRFTDGTWADNPRIKIPSFPVHIQGDDIMIELPDPPSPQSAGDSP